jgi:hypothetical protein
MANRYQLALKKEDPKQEKINKALKDVSAKETDAVKERKVLLKSLLEQAVENSGVSVVEDPPRLPIQEVEIQDRGRAAVYRPNSTYHPVAPPPRPLRGQTRAYRHADDDFFEELQRPQEEALDNSVVMQGDGTIRGTSSPRSSNLMIRSPGGQSYSIPLRFLECRFEDGNLILGLPGNTARDVYNNIVAERSRRMIR